MIPTQATNNESQLKSPQELRATNSIPLASNTSSLCYLPHGVLFRFDYPFDSDVTNLVYRIIRVRDNKVLRFQAMNLFERSTHFLHESELGLNRTEDEGRSLRFEVYGQRADERGPVVAHTIQIQYPKLRQPGYKHKFKFVRTHGFDGSGNMVRGWNEQELGIIKPKIEDARLDSMTHYGPTAINGEILVYRLIGSNVATKRPELFSMNLDPNADIRLIRHEVGHLHPCPVVFSINERSNLIPDHSGDEEARREFEARLYDRSPIWNAELYDVYNRMKSTQHTDFWWAGGALREQYIKYGMGAMMWMKLHLRNPRWVTESHKNMIDLLAPGNIGTSRDLIIQNLVETAEQINKEEGKGRPVMEGDYLEDWLNTQANFKMEKLSGKQLFVRIEPNYSHNETITQIACFPHEIFANGQAWSYNDGNQTFYHSDNDALLNLSIKGYDGTEIFRQDNIATQERVNPPAGKKWGGVKVIISSMPEGEDSYIDQPFFDNYIRIRIPEIQRLDISFDWPDEGVSESLRLPAGFIPSDTFAVVMTDETFDSDHSYFISGQTEQAITSKGIILVSQYDKESFVLSDATNWNDKTRYYWPSSKPNIFDLRPLTGLNPIFEVEQECTDNSEELNSLRSFIHDLKEEFAGIEVAVSQLKQLLSKHS